MQVVGVGSQGDFAQVQQFLDDMSMETPTMLWEQSGHAWQLNDVTTNSAMHLYHYDLTEKSKIIYFTAAGRQVILDAAIQTPWAPTSRLNG